MRKYKIFSLCIFLFLTSCIVFSHKTPIPTKIPPTPEFSLVEKPTSTLTTEPTATPENTATVTLEPTATPTLAPVFPFDYQVQAGDNLGSISEKFGVSSSLIILENDLANPDLILAGQNLRIPDPNSTPKNISKTEKQILVILSLQKAYAYENGQLVREFTVSTGVAKHPTVTGTFHIYLKYDKTRMKGEGYDLPNVPWTMYFYEGYGFHGTYWHHNFGHPMSHGCVNMKTDEAKWLYDWAPHNTTVIITP